MKNGVLHPTPVPPFPGNSCYVPGNTKSVGGCIVGPDLSALSVVIVTQDESDIVKAGGQRMQVLEVMVIRKRSEGSYASSTDIPCQQDS